ncbi:LEAF RUST 10 DISEASE-RESISTANCE LOCUS RECEPTOR-LIKE PROTEIN KINASE-like protein 2.4 isoform X2 [Cinnamomum micranthum f. kanehirae]|uniref:LEAF RUST 10 DISEASE-RESISTANCE LOCUS RECEPTOR-LIKE PROTEIN KINASE-like protein 2.4 isoform X2 n=1 Tax=Cinnamomum micranthum f. kanehirae TaxID=337451 RepID=A0A3S3NLE0_9MAGN|nr:LEAF RUST 10 DISEASE-RESISTANCE LOCUS RECEPTOR-LIKE PROTEIN KINASE-like protein 2.4 isoform X2 [Cinnamomum micranthum f. kanehirae]
MDTFPIHQSLSSFLLIVLLFFTPASFAQEYNQRFPDCFPIPFDCGGVQLNISYPFWTEDTPENCRYPNELEIKCNMTANSSEIVIQKRPYDVTRIDYENQTATIVDKDYYLMHNDMIPCHAPSSNTSLDFNLFNYTQRYLNLLFLDDCPDPLPQNHLYLKSLNCSSDHAFYFTEEHITSPSINCSVIQISILRTNKDRLWEKPEGSWIDVLSEGFEVAWSFTKLDHLCWDCFKSNGHCRFNEASYFQRDCYCNGTSFPDECPPPPAKHLVSSSLFLIMTSDLDDAACGGGHGRKMKSVLGAVIGVGILILTCSFVFILNLVRRSSSYNSIFWKNKTHDSGNVEAFLENYCSLVPKRYRNSELRKLTNSFKDNLGQEKTSEIYFPHWVYKHIELKESLALLGFQSEAEADIGRKMVLVGLWCIQTDPTNLPSMTKVVEMLEGSLGSLEMPPKPFLCSPSRSFSSTTLMPKQERSALLYI